MKKWLSLPLKKNVKNVNLVNNRDDDEITQLNILKF